MVMHAAFSYSLCVCVCVCVSLETSSSVHGFKLSTATGDHYWWSEYHSTRLGLGATLGTLILEKYWNFQGRWISENS
jgi:hypothetical protein